MRKLITMIFILLISNIGLAVENKEIPKKYSSKSLVQELSESETFEVSGEELQEEQDLYSDSTSFVEDIF